MGPEITPQKLNNLVKEISNFITKFFNKTFKNLVCLLRLTFDESISITQQVHHLPSGIKLLKIHQNYVQASSASTSSNQFFYK